MTRPKARSQDVAAVKLVRARQIIAEKTRAMARIATSLRMWERRAAAYAKAASWTDAEIAARRAKRIEDAVRHRKIRRGIELTG